MSALQAKKQEERNANILKELRNQPENKRCMDCLAQYPQYVVLDFGTWVCASCSGLHREFNHKIKSPSMSTFKEEEIQKLQCQGNGVAKDTWRAKWSVRDFPEPEAGNTSKTREFIRATYVEKRWFVPLPQFASGNNASSSNSSTSNNTSTSSQNQTKPKPVNNTLIDWDEPAPPVNTNNQSYPPQKTPQPFQDPFAVNGMNNNSPSNQFAQNPFLNPQAVPSNNQPVQANPFNNFANFPQQQNQGFGTQNFANFPSQQNQGFPQQNQGFGGVNQGFTQQQNQGFQSQPQNQGLPQNQGFGGANQGFPQQQNQGFGGFPQQQNQGFQNSTFGQNLFGGNQPQPNPQQAPQQQMGFQNPSQPVNQGFNANPFAVMNNAPKPNVAQGYSNAFDPFASNPVNPQPIQQQGNNSFFNPQSNQQGGANPFDIPKPTNNAPQSSSLDLDFFSAPKPAPVQAAKPQVQAPKPQNSAPPPRVDETAANSCPICTISFTPGMTNGEINKHIDECLNSATLEDIQVRGFL
eukprot:TRINITY_DN1365_c0_g2_i3.p1 TRINITY_DN1365_c0_g2~~TRINITY_DN1365_c0_g2_i3.p1  ORF type:complete len:520 (+),score=209.27 TRINITY_DN1365_c0_g2_i3:135-1694(+)